MRIALVTPGLAEPNTRLKLLPDAAVGADVEIVVRGTRAGTLGNRLDETRLAVAVAEAAIPAESEGCDAIVIDSIADPALYALRSRLRIPVVGPGLTAYTTALNLGRTFSVLLPAEESAHAVESSLRLYGLESRCVSIRELAADTRTATAPEADVVILGSTQQHALARDLATAAEVPVIDPGVLALQTAERLVRLGLTHSKVAFPPPHVSQDEKLTPLIEALSRAEL